MLKFGNLLVYGLCSESETYVSVDMGKFDIFSRVTHPSMFLFYFFPRPQDFLFSSRILMPQILSCFTQTPPPRESVFTSDV